MRILSCIIHARRATSVDELRHGFAVECDEDEEGPEELDKDNLLSPGSLVDVRASKYRPATGGSRATFQLSRGMEMSVSADESDK